MRNQLSLIKGYSQHWLNAVNEHSLHAPFIYEFYTQVIKSPELPLEVDIIEPYRQQFLASPAVIEVTDYGAGAGNQQRRLNNIAKNTLVSPKYAALLYRCARYAQAKYTLELGTSLGISTLYLASAPDNQVHTIEGCPAIAALAKDNFDRWPYQNITQIIGNIDDVLPQVLATMPKIDMLYLDANHRFEPTLRYFRMCKEKAHENSIFVLDDIYWSDDMRRAWQYIRQDTDVSLSLDLFDVGIVLFKELKNKQHYSLLF